MIFSSIENKIMAVFDQTVSHVAEVEIVEALALARENGCDAVIGPGGASTSCVCRANMANSNTV
jgi:alcohol dehydrogenase class IV